jgi:hypothetical protein
LMKIACEVSPLASPVRSMRRWSFLGGDSQCLGNPGVSGKLQELLVLGQYSVAAGCGHERKEE